MYIVIKTILTDKTFHVINDFDNKIIHTNIFKNYIHFITAIVSGI